MLLSPQSVEHRTWDASVNRDLVTERWLILEAAKAYGFDGADLADLAMGRAGVTDVRDLHDRDFGLEAVQEQADSLNYSTWGIAQLQLFPDSEERCEAMTELAELMKCSAGAWYHAERFRHLMRNIRNDVKQPA